MFDSKTLIHGRRRTLFSLLIIVVLLAGTVSAALAWVGTDQTDYSPGSVVTISGDNRDGAGYLPDETVAVHVDGPNGYTADCSGVADANGAWSCQVTLWDSYLAVGEYSYTATGQNVSESGTFTDGNVKVFAAPSGVTFTLTATGYSAANCTGTPTTTNPFGTFAAVNSTDGKTIGVGSRDSVKLEAAAFSDQGGAFQGWTGAVTAGTLAICVANPSGTATYYANYATPPTNTPPTVDAGGPYSGNEGSAIAIAGTANDPDSDPLTYLWTYSIVSADAGATCSFADDTALSTTVTCTDDGTYTLTLTATGDPAGPVSDTAGLTVSNVAPTVTLSGPSTANEGDTESYTFTTSDPGANDTFTGSASCGASGAVQNFTINSATGVGSFDCYFADDDPTGTASDTSTVEVTVNDDDTGSGSDSIDVTVSNVAPTVTLSDPSAANEGDTKSYTFDTSDPGVNDTFTGSASCGASGTVQDFTINSATGDGSFDCEFADDNPTGTPSDTSTVAVTVTDDDTGSDSGSIDVTVSNVAPVITSFVCPANPVAVNTPVTLAGAFTDVGTADTHTASIAWGDSSSSAATVTQGSGSGTVSGSHTYSSAGIYTPQLTVTDDDTGSASTNCQYVVVYDPSAGFVTGGGWINSPAGAYVADPNLTGRANFGFVSKYKRGQSVPDGQTQFQFQAGNLNFHSTAYQWLVVSGAKATYKGWGTINGSGNYGFLLSAIDGQRNGGGGIDKFRIKIWDVTSSAVVYDNNLGGGDDADPTTALGGGSIVIHSN